MSTKRFGATVDDWRHWAKKLGLVSELLPVVSNPSATIAPTSSLKSLGKTPSVYRGDGLVVGLSEWTSKQATLEEASKWAAQPDYGICLQTRQLHAIDIDISNADTVAGIIDLLGPLASVRRGRQGSPRALILIRPTEDLAEHVRGSKPIIRTADGIVEYLAYGRQCVVAGEHTSGARYEWFPALPTEFPTVDLATWKALWSAIETVYATAPAVTTEHSSTVTRQERTKDATENDPVANYLFDNDWVKSSHNGQLNIRCPWEKEHTTEGADSATTYFVRFTHGYEMGHFKCLHAHCAHRKDEDFRVAIGYEQDIDTMFGPIDDTPAVPTDEDYPDLGPEPEDEPEEKPKKKGRFSIQSVDEFLETKPASWLLKGALPAGGFVVISGAPSSGKTFFALDLASAAARGIDWRGHKSKKAARVVYVCAEGAAGFRNRLHAYLEINGPFMSMVDSTYDFGIIAGQPNILEKDDVVQLVKMVGAADIVVFDTFASVMPGDENSSIDMGKAIRHCQAIIRRTGATVILVHHTTKDGRVSRGHSSLPGAADTMIEISRFDDGTRAALFSKVKDGQDGMDYGFVLNVIEIGKDEDGEAITSCVISDAPSPVREKKGKKKARESGAGFEEVPGSTDLIP